MLPFIYCSKYPEWVLVEFAPEKAKAKEIKLCLVWSSCPELTLAHLTFLFSA